MKYIITKKQYNLILESSEEEKLLKVPDLSFFANNWDVLQAYLKSEGNPRYYVDGNLDLRNSDITSLGNLIRVEGFLDLEETNIKSLGNLKYVGGYLHLVNTPLSKITTHEEIISKVGVEGNIYLS